MSLPVLLGNYNSSSIILHNKARVGFVLIHSLSRRHAERHSFCSQPAARAPFVDTQERFFVCSSYSEQTQDTHTSNMSLFGGLLQGIFGIITNALSWLFGITAALAQTSTNG